MSAAVPTAHACCTRLSVLAPFWNLDLHVAHLDHRLRPESAGDAAFVGQLAANLGLPCHLRQLERDALHAGSGGLENAARHARYLFLCQIAHAVTPPLQEQILVVAHQKNDQAETLIMNLLRGSGLNGLSANALDRISIRPLAFGPFGKR